MVENPCTPPYRVLFVNPPFYRLWGSHFNGLMLGIASLTAVLRRAGCDAWQLNADFELSSEYPSTRQIYLNATGQSDWIAPLTETFRETAEAIVAFEPDVVGYTSFSSNYGSVASIATWVRELYPKAVQIIGGPHATVDAAAAERIPSLNYRFTGEAEETLLDFLSRPLRTVNGRRIQDLDYLPIVNREHWWSLAGRAISDTERKYLNTAYISTSRGCPYECAFCSAPRLWDRRVTYRGVDHVLEEWQWLSQRTRHEIHVVDDTFAFNKPRALAIMQGLRDWGISAPWKCESRADAIDEEIADAMAASGCRRVKMGFESGSDRILVRVRKRETKDQMRRAVRTLKARGLAVTGYWIAGYPEETDDDLRQTIDFARELELDTCSLNMFAPYPGSEFHAKMHGDWDYLIEQEPWKLFGQSRVEEVNPNLSPKLIEEYWSLSGERKV